MKDVYAISKVSAWMLAQSDEPIAVMKRATSMSSPELARTAGLPDDDPAILDEVTAMQSRMNLSMRPYLEPVSG